MREEKEHYIETTLYLVWKSVQHLSPAERLAALEGVYTDSLVGETRPIEDINLLSGGIIHVKQDGQWDMVSPTQPAYIY